MSYVTYHSVHPDQHGPQRWRDWEVDAQQSVEEEDEGYAEHDLTGDDVSRVKPVWYNPQNQVHDQEKHHKDYLTERAKDINCFVLLKRILCE